MLIIPYQEEAATGEKISIKTGSEFYGSGLSSYGEAVK
jgi:hypothetical protein